MWASNILIIVFISSAGVERVKETPAEVVEEESVKPEGLVIKRRVSTLVTTGQAISVLGSQAKGLKEEDDGAPLAKKRPEPIVPTTQIRYDGWRPAPSTQSNCRSWECWGLQWLGGVCRPPAVIINALFIWQLTNY